jgi:dipeptidyl aminopeptidase/acylaminoacyl peptidase
MPGGSCDSAEVNGKSCALQQVTRVNEELLSSLKLSKPEPFTFKSTDGLELDGWVMKPIDFDAGKKYPAVIQVHGGPHSAYGEAFFHEMQLLTSTGFGVFYCNPRGSSCYGKKFADGVIGDWGGMDYQDIMALRDVVAKTPWVDDSKVGITGGSYGGYMTNWVVGQTDRFAAAVSCRSISNMYTKYGVSDIGWFGNRAGFAGRDLWDSEDFIMERSPIRYAPKVVTPLLLVHSEQDYRCPLEQAEQFFVALKRLGKTVEFLKIAGENHELSRSGKPWNRIERVEHIVEWFVRFLK